MAHWGRVCVCIWCGERSIRIGTEHANGYRTPFWKASCIVCGFLAMPLLSAVGITMRLCPRRQGPPWSPLARVSPLGRSWWALAFCSPHHHPNKDTRLDLFHQTHSPTKRATHNTHAWQSCWYATVHPHSPHPPFILPSHRQTEPMLRHVLRSAPSSRVLTVQMRGLAGEYH